MKKRTQLDAYIEYETESDKFKNFVLPYPFSMCYKVNQKCNYSCKHCIASGNISASNGLCTEESKAIIKQIRDCGVPRIDITGGEPFMRDDILELLDYCKELGLNTVITTNGSLLTEEHLTFLLNNNIYVQVSLDGDKAINDQLRGDGTYQETVIAIKRILKMGINLRVNVTMQRKNKDCLEDLLNILNVLEVKSVYVIFACAQGRAYQLDKNIFLTYNEIENIKKQIKLLDAKYEDISLKILDFKTFEYSCVLVDTNGDLISQSWSEKDCVVVGNLLKENLKDLWMDSSKFNHTVHLLQYLCHPLVMA